MAPALGEAQLRRRRVRAQLLGDEPEPAVEPAAVVSRLVGVQAQDLRAAALSIRARTRGLLSGDVDAGFAPPPSLVLTWSLRGTRHLHHADDVRWLLRVLGPVFARPGRRAEQLGIAGEVGERAVRMLHETLTDSGPLDRDGVKRLLADHGVDPSGQAPIHVVRRAALEGVLCVEPQPGGERYVALDDRVPRGEPVDPDVALARLAHRYLVGHGPSAADDFAAWSGLGAGAVSAAWDAIRDDVSEVRVRGQQGGMLSCAHDGSEGHDGELTVATLRLAGAFDALLLAYADRSPHLPPERTRDVNAGGGLVKPVVVADGQVVGTWRYDRRAERAEVRAFCRLTGNERRQLDDEVDDLGRFLGTDPTLALTVG